MFELLVLAAPVALSLMGLTLESWRKWPVFGLGLLSLWGAWGATTDLKALRESAGRTEADMQQLRTDLTTAREEASKAREFNAGQIAVLSQLSSKTLEVIATGRATELAPVQEKLDNELTTLRQRVAQLEQPRSLSEEQVHALASALKDSTGRVRIVSGSTEGHDYGSAFEKAIKQGGWGASNDVILLSPEVYDLQVYAVPGDPSADALMRALRVARVDNLNRLTVTPEEAARGAPLQLAIGPRLPGPKYAVVSKDAEIVEERNFAQYGMTVSKEPEHKPDGTFSWFVYHLRFEFEPASFEVRTDAGATAARSKLGPNHYRVVFVGVGFGDPVVEVDFKVVVE